jgi:hypothetical protein
MWIVQDNGKEGRPALFWTGREWEQRAELARKYQSGEEAQKVADAFHIVNCKYNYELAKRTIKESLFCVIDYPSGTLYIPSPMTKINHLLVRVSES